MSVDEIFRLLLAQKQARERENEEQQEPGLRPVMVDRLTTSPSGMVHSSSAEQDISRHSREDTKPRRRRSNIENSPKKSEVWTRGEIRRHSYDNPHDVLDRQFSAMYDNQPSLPAAVSYQQPRIKRRSRDMTTSISTKDHDSDDDVLISPLQRVNPFNVHDGNIQRQLLGDTKGITVSDRMDILVPKGKTRSSILTNHSVSQPTPLQISSTHQFLTTSPGSPLRMGGVMSPNELLTFKVRLKTIIIIYYIFVHFIRLMVIRKQG